MINLIGKNIKFFDELDSTNNFVKMNISNLDHGTVVVAKIQTEGRGRRDNIWMSKEGNLYFSIVLKDKINRNSIFKYIVESSLAIIMTLKEYNINAVIKYPNDCLIEGNKVSGVLIESLGSNKLEYIVVGIGINVNQINFDNLSSKATSMKKELRTDFNIKDILSNFIKNYNFVVMSDYSNLFKEYLSYSIVINKKISYQDKEYEIVNIEKDGIIIIKNKDGELRVAYNEISLKEIY